MPASTSKSRDTLDTLVRGAAAAGATVVLATHELERIAALEPRVVSVVGGVVRSEGDDAATEGDRRVS